MHTLSAHDVRGSRRGLRRFVGGSLAAVLLAQAAVADAAASSLWTERRRPQAVAASVSPRPLSVALNARLSDDGVERFSSLVLPAHGTIRPVGVRSGARKGAVLLIQDVHLNAEAQRNISSAIATLAAGNAIGLVAVEGSTRRIPVEAFRSAPDADSLKSAADFLLHHDQISGSVHAAIAGAAPVPVNGIDDRALHDENAEAFRVSAAALPDFRAFLDAQRRQVAAEKAAHFNSSLRAFDARVASYRDGDQTFTAHVTALTTIAARQAIAVPADLRDFVEAARLETSLDSARVERERAAALTRMAGGLSAGDAAALLKAGIAFRSRQITHADFYRTFAALGAKAGLRPSDTPELQRYLRYLALADGIDGARTLAAADALERTLYARLIHTPRESAIAASDRAVHLARKLSGFALTRAEWREWSSTARAFAGAAAFERFYAAAARRDAALSDNLLARLSDAGARSAVAVVGGFHADGVAGRLSEAGYDVALFTPALTHVDDNGSAYLSVFSREKTPLERLFDGQKLFLAADPMSDAAAVSLADLTSARALTLGRAGDWTAWFRRALGLSLTNRVRAGRMVRHTFALADGSERTLDTVVTTTGRFETLPTLSNGPTGTFALGKRLFGPFTDRWVELTLRFSPLLELPQIYLSAFSRGYRAAFLTPSPTLAAKQDALSVVHRGMFFAAGLAAVTGFAGVALFGAAPSLPSLLISGLGWSFAFAAAASLFPALWLHDLANADPNTRLTEGDPGSYPERLRAYLAGLTGAPNAVDPATTQFQLIAAETKNLLRRNDQRDVILTAWQAALEGYRAPFEDMLIALFRGWARVDPGHVIPPVEELVTEFSRHHDRAATGPLIEFVVDAFSSAISTNLRGKKDEMWARDSEPLRILEVTPEVRPFKMSGGMAVVNGELPNELNRFHAWATTVSLYYDDGKYDLDGEGSPFTRKEKMPFDLKVTIDGELHIGEVYRVRRRSDDGTLADFYFIKDTFEGSDNLSRKLYPTERRLHQAVFLSEGSLQLMKELRKAGGKRFDVLRAHDWVAGLAAIYVKTRTYSEDPEMQDALKGVHPMAFLHNLEPGYKGGFTEREWRLLGLDDSHKQAFGWTQVNGGQDFAHYLNGFDPQQMSIVKALSHHAEAMFVPAPRYAQLIQMETYGYEMASMFRARAHILFGVLNGTEYDPKDELLYPKGRRPVADFLEHQARAKVLLLKEAGLYEKIEAEVRVKLQARDGHVNQDAFNMEMAMEIDRPILGAVLRLDPKMKGVWFFKSVGERLTHPETPRPIRVILLGSALKGQEESEDFVRQMTALAEARPTRIAFFPIGRQMISKAGKADADRLRLGRRIDSLNDLIQAATIGFYPSKVEPGGLADVESMERGAPVIVSDKGGFYDKARDFDDDSITDREPTGAVFRGEYWDHEAMIRVVERVVNLYYNDRDRFNRIAANNKNVRFTMSRMARTHVVSMARVIGRLDIAETPEKPVHRSALGAIGAWKMIGLSNPVVIGAVEGLLAVLFVLWALVTFVPAAAAPSLLMVSVITSSASAVVFAGLWVAHYFGGLIESDGWVNRAPSARQALSATFTASTSLIGVIFLAMAVLAPGVQQNALIVIGLGAGAIAHALTNLRIIRATPTLKPETAHVNSSAAPVDEYEQLFIDAMRSNVALSDQALRTLEDRLNDKDREVHARALRTLGKIAKGDRDRISDVIVARTLDLLEQQEVPLHTYSAAVEIFLQRRDIASPRTLRIVEVALTRFVSGTHSWALSPTIGNLTDAILLLGNRMPRELQESSIQALESVMRTEGVRPSSLEFTSRTITRIFSLRPDLVRPGTLAATLYTNPYALRQQPWPHFDLIAMDPFPVGMNMKDRYSIGLAAYRLLLRYRVPLTKPNAVIAVNQVIRRRADRSGVEIISPAYHVITATHAEERFRNERMETIALKAGVPQNQISEPFKGASTKRAVRKKIIETVGPLAFMFDGHGGPNHLWLEKQTDEVSSDLEDMDGISYHDLGDALLEYARRNGDFSDLSRATVVISSCYSYDFAIGLYRYLKEVGVTNMPIVITAAGRHQVSFGNVMWEVFDEKIPSGPLTLGSVFAAEAAGFDKTDFTDFGIFDTTDDRAGEALGSSRKPAAMELGLSRAVALILGAVGIRSAFAVAILGAAAESGLIRFGLPVIFQALGFSSETVIIAAQLLLFPALHAFGVLSATADRAGRTSLVNNIPTSGRLLRLAALGILFHAILPGGAGLITHILMNAGLVLLAKRTSPEAALARDVAAAAAERLRSGGQGAAWIAAMRAMVSGRAQKLGMGQFGGTTGATLADVDTDTFDMGAFNTILASELAKRGLLRTVEDSDAFHAAQDVALAGEARVPLATAIARMDRGQTNVIVAESLSDEALAAAIARLRADPEITAALILKAGSEKSDRIAREMAALKNVTPMSSDNIYSDDNGRVRVKLANLDARLTAESYFNGRIHLWSGREVEFDTEGLPESSLLREALFTILDAMSVTTSFPRIELMDSVYRLMASQA